MTGWSSAQREAIAGAQELEIAVRREDGEDGRWTPIWVVVVGDDVLVRTWHLRDTGWYGRARRAGSARVRVPGASAEVRVEQVGGAHDRAAVDTAYRQKYGTGGAESMTSEEAAASTLLLRPESRPSQ